MASTPALLRLKKTQKKGIKFTVMLCGSGGSGKSTFINTLCQQQVMSPGDMMKSIPTPTTANNDPGIAIVPITVELPDEGNGILSIKFIDTPGFGDNLDNQGCFSEISSYIDQQFDDVLAEESRIKRNPRFTDNRVHALLYFIVATSHGLREQDIEFMKLMSTRVNVIPVISKADTLTVEELELNKKLVMQDIAYYNIPIYNFPMEDDADEEMDDEFIELNAYLRKTLPFAVIGASEMLNMSGKRMQVRRFPWGVVDVNDSKYSDVAALREVLTRTHLSDLKDNTHFVLYENYRTDKLSKDLPGTAAPTPNLDKNGSTSQFQQLAMPRTPFTGGGATLGDAESGTSSLLVREEQLRAEEEKLRMIELKVQNEIAQKRRELFAREQELKELEAKLKTDPDAMRFASPSLKQEMA